MTKNKKYQEKIIFFFYYYLKLNNKIGEKFLKRLPFK